MISSSLPSCGFKAENPLTALNGKGNIVEANGCDLNEGSNQTTSCSILVKQIAESQPVFNMFRHCSIIAVIV